MLPNELRKSLMRAYKGGFVSGPAVDIPAHVAELPGYAIVVDPNNPDNG